MNRTCQNTGATPLNPHPSKSMKACSSRKTTSATALNSILVWLCLLVAATSGASAQTMVSGDISSTWSPSGNPYIITDNATVPGGKTLTIQPGAVVMIGSGLSVTASGVMR